MSSSVVFVLIVLVLSAAALVTFSKIDKRQNRSRKNVASQDGSFLQNSGRYGSPLAWPDEEVGRATKNSIVPTAVPKPERRRDSRAPAAQAANKRVAVSTSVEQGTNPTNEYAGLWFGVQLGGGTRAMGKAAAGRDVDQVVERALGEVGKHRKLRPDESGAALDIVLHKRVSDSSSLDADFGSLVCRALEKHGFDTARLSIKSRSINSSKKELSSVRSPFRSAPEGWSALCWLECEVTWLESKVDDLIKIADGQMARGVHREALRNYRQVFEFGPTETRYSVLAKAVKIAESGRDLGVPTERITTAEWLSSSAARVGDSGLLGRAQECVRVAMEERDKLEDDRRKLEAETLARIRAQEAGQRESSKEHKPE